MGVLAKGVIAGKNEFNQEKNHLRPHLFSFNLVVSQYSQLETAENFGVPRVSHKLQRKQPFTAANTAIFYPLRGVFPGKF